LIFTRESWFLGGGPHEHTETRVMKVNAGGRRQRVLVVDDEPDTTEILSVLLRILGHEARAVTRGRDALAAAREFDPDLIMLDIALPDISGYEVVRELKRQATRKRFIAAASGYGSDRDRDRAREAGFDAHLLKPLDAKKIRHLLMTAEAQLAS
jgi:two-component system, sensor histidine kinase